MEIQVDQAQGRMPVTIIRLRGDLDSSSYRAVIARAKTLREAGQQAFLLDLGATPYMSSAGIVALHTIALLVRDGDAPDPEAEGWRAMRAISDSPAAGVHAHLKLLNPQPRVLSVLEQVGLKASFEIHTDEAAAIASF